MSAADVLPINVEQRDPVTEKKRNSAIKGGFFSILIDMFDIYLPVIILAPIQSYFLPSGLTSSNREILESLIFATTLLGRPIGAALFGRVADRLGRREASIISVTGFSAVTFLIAFLPGYAQIGTSSYVLLVAMRFVDGIFLGGGYTGAIPLAIESAKKSQRGFVGGLVMAGYPVAYILINLIALGTLAIFPNSGTDGPYAQWGWRLPFLIGAVLSASLAAYYVRKVPESAIWQQQARLAAGGPHSDVARPAAQRTAGSARAVLQVLLMMTGFWLTQNVIGAFLPAGVLIHTLHLTSQQMTVTLLCVYAVMFFGYLLAGVVGQRIGRRRFLVISGLLQASLAAFLLYKLINGGNTSLPLIIVTTCCLALLVNPCWAALITYMNERFATGVRATGFGFGYSFSVIVPSFYAFYIDALGHVVPLQFAPVGLLVIGGIIGAVGVALGPKTNHIDL